MRRCSDVSVHVGINSKDLSACAAVTSLALEPVSGGLSLTADNLVFPSTRGVSSPFPEG